MSRWHDYGYPDPEFLPWLNPLHGLWLALRERRVAVKLEPELEISPEPQPDPLTIAQTDYLYRFDELIKMTAGSFVNHVGGDFSVWVGLPLWTWDDLIDSLAEHEAFAGGIVMAGDRFLPEHFVLWARQRQAMIDQLKFLRVPYLGDTYSGHVHTGVPLSPEEAIAAAEAQGARGFDVSDPAVGAYITTIWGPDHGWNYGTYCADIYQVGNLRVDTDQIGAAAVESARLYLFVDAPRGNRDLFDAFGTGLTLGLNVLYAPFPVWQLPLQAEKVWTPTPGKTYTFGFSTRAICVADFSSSFEFYDGEHVA